MFLTKLSLNAERNWHQNKGANRRDRINDKNMNPARLGAAAWSILARQAPGRNRATEPFLSVQARTKRVRLRLSFLAGRNAVAQSIDARGEPSTEPTLPEELASSERETLMRLGAAVLNNWDQLPRDRQQKIFSAAMAEPGNFDIENVRRKLAVILHSHHSRTGRVARGLEDSRPPAGPHARAELTNFDATPGSGVLPPRKGRDKEVDPGAG
jgi:hypothetical protein